MADEVHDMTVGESATQGGAQGVPPAERPAGWRRRARRAVGSVCVISAAAMAAGFVWFVWSVPTEEIALDRDADGIVVLTGGTSRVADAIELLAEGRGKRLLISGAHPATTLSEIARLVPAREQLVACCVDLDPFAVNTVGNATGTRRWVLTRGFRSLIVVTSNYHMPRTMAELARQMPDITLIAFPVVADKQRAERWWTSPLITRLLVSEYLKYILAQVRMRIETVSAAAPSGSRLAAR
jgi:uncharacterized SAM-binding protein YcdF (DUF218 family)